jgi:hypothetical protein
MALQALGAEIMAVSTVQGAAAVEIRARFVQPGLTRNMTVAVMTALGPIAITAVQVVAGVTHVSIRFQLLMGASSMNPVRRCFIPGGPEVALTTFE